MTGCTECLWGGVSLESLCDLLTCYREVGQKLVSSVPAKCINWLCSQMTCKVVAHSAGLYRRVNPFWKLHLRSLLQRAATLLWQWAVRCDVLSELPWCEQSHQYSLPWVHKAGSQKPYSRVCDYLSMSSIIPNEGGPHPLHNWRSCSNKHGSKVWES